MQPREITPFVVHQRQPMSAKVPDLAKAQEAKPLLFFGALPAVFAPNLQGKNLTPTPAPVVENMEAEVPSEGDPKAASANSSAQDSVPSSQSDSPKSGPTHPSTLSAPPADPVTAVKGLNPTLPLL